MLKINDTLPADHGPNTPDSPTARGEGKDYLVDHLECALVLAGQRGLQLTINLIAMAIESLKELSGGGRVKPQRGAGRRAT